MELTHEEFCGWCKMHGFEGPESWWVSAKSKLQKTKPGRPAEYNWPGVKQRLTEYASKHGPIETLDELLQKCGEFASELHPKGNEPDDKTIREAIKTHKLEAAARSAPGK
jgi:hypothetical protein